MNRSRSMTIVQRITMARLMAEGFAVVQEENTVVRMKRGNDCRLVQMDGTQKRAVGGKR
jgi:hypothetical protein